MTRRSDQTYGVCDNGFPIVTPRGWILIPEGGDIPQRHREFIDYMGVQQWAAPRRCHSTMTPLYACVFGAVRAFAKVCP